jgi:hypothetical protein
MKISEILRLAANEYLAASRDDYFCTNKKRFSCDAVEQAVRQAPDVSLFVVYEFLQKLGVGIRSIREFREFESSYELITEEAQGARFLWLHFAALVAEDMEERGEL